MSVLSDFINMTQGQLLLKYWWLWGIIVAVAIISMVKNAE